MPTTAQPTPTTLPQIFTGKERDIESGLDYFGARYYASSMGRWMSPDWADKPEAVPYSSLGDPQSLNLYGYVRNNPMNSVDADGHAGDHGAAWDSMNENIAYATGGNVDTMGSFGIGSSDAQAAIGSVVSQQQSYQAAKADLAQQQTSSTPAQPSPQQGHFEYDQRTGQTTHVLPDGSRVAVGTGYSGQGNGLNNPSEQYTPNTGPIPQGTYTVEPQRDNVTGAGHRLPGSMRLDPTPGTDTHGRAGFLIHGDNPRGDHSASNGCIVLPRPVRNVIGGSSDHTLVVVP